MKREPQDGFTPLESPALCRNKSVGKSFLLERASYLKRQSFLTGFTLLELIVVLAIISLASAMGIAILWNFNKDLGVRATSNYVLSLLRFAHSQAQASSTPASFVYDIGGKRMYILTAQQVGVWHFEDLDRNETKGAFEKVGKVTGAILAPGKIGSALKFSGEDFVECTEIPALDPQQGLAIEFWVYPELLGREQYIFSKGDELAIAIGRNGKINTKIGSTSLNSGDLTLPLEQWIHIEIVYAQNRAALFVQGNEVASRAGKANWINDSHIMIGALKDKKTKKGVAGFVGSIDELKIGLLLPQKEYKVAGNAQIEFQGVNPGREEQFIINFDKEGKLDSRNLSSLPTVNITAEGETKSIRIDRTGWAEIVK